MTDNNFSQHLTTSSVEAYLDFYLMFSNTVIAVKIKIVPLDGFLTSLLLDGNPGAYQESFILIILFCTSYIENTSMTRKMVPITRRASRFLVRRRRGRQFSTDY